MLRVTFRTLASASTKARYAFYTVCLVNSVLVGVWAIMDLAISGNPSTSKIGELYHCVALEFGCPNVSPVQLVWQARPWRLPS